MRTPVFLLRWGGWTVPEITDNRNLHAGRTGTTRDETHGIIGAAEKMPLLMGEKLGIEIV